MNKPLYPELPILLVDDEESFLVSLRATLRVDGITNVECCQDSRDVIPLLAQKKFSLIILDILMPHTRGDALLPQILEEQPDVKVIMLTAVNEVETAVECMSVGAMDYLVKPVEKSELIEKVKKILHSIYSGKIKKIFISYSHHDQEFADRLVNDLKNAGMEVWIDEKKIKVGSSIPEEINRGISRCHFFCIILSRHSVKSTWVEKECKMALNAQKQSSLHGIPGLLPILIQEVELPLLLKDIRCAEFLWSYDRGLNQILDAIKSCNLNITS
ncbi:MAG: response regulator [Candidatus Aminicenantes bacterium]|jgi:DNA-binding response OmpR family regulator